MLYQHLTLEGRSMIAPMRILGWSVRNIAAQLGRAPSTISRALRRNHDGTGAYSGYWAHRDAQRRRRAVRRSCLTSGVLATYTSTSIRVRLFYLDSPCKPFDVALSARSEGVGYLGVVIWWVLLRPH